MMNKETEQKRTITLELSETICAFLEVLGEPKHVIMELIDHAQQGVYRPGAWERDWLCQAFGDDWLERLEPGDPYGRPEKAKTPKGLEYFYCTDCERTHDAQRETIPQACIDRNEERQASWSIRRVVRGTLRNVGYANGALLLHANGSALGNPGYSAKEGG